MPFLIRLPILYINQSLLPYHSLNEHSYCSDDKEIAHDRSGKPVSDLPEEKVEKKADHIDDQHLYYGQELLPVPSFQDIFMIFKYQSAKQIRQSDDKRPGLIHFKQMSSGKSVSDPESKKKSNDDNNDI